MYWIAVSELKNTGNPKDGTETTDQREHCSMLRKLFKVFYQRKFHANVLVAFKSLVKAPLHKKYSNKYQTAQGRTTKRYVKLEVWHTKIRFKLNQSMEIWQNEAQK